ncbi:hypothetical protein GCM10007977_110570 [Dactylosporangium sucinum]|uniref:Uncharacterized protein n=1 Tax=Dactylosporangium sucinum TaxID=1424081 RepID=A0A917X8P1_9ACTN|nr:hypothetical protein GCM10007977_110570 [Dactylosporangium sucinum]
MPPPQQQPTRSAPAATADALTRTHRGRSAAALNHRGRPGRGDADPPPQLLRHGAIKAAATPRRRPVDSG